MHPAAKQYLSLPPEQQKAVQLRLCERALEIWENVMPKPIVYRDKTTGTLQFLEVGLLREAILSVKMGQDKYLIAQRFVNPMSGLQDGSFVVPEKARFAYFSIHNLFATHILRSQNDPWLVTNQALAALSDENIIEHLQWAISAVR
ncbi:MAG: hypothetical protein C4516_02310 [Oxalobacter sp.]|nr:MAG: hypothetical protein C4516_02310 [Oxalobacter sp.]